MTINWNEPMVFVSTCFGVAGVIWAIATSLAKSHDGLVAKDACHASMDKIDIDIKELREDFKDMRKEHSNDIKGVHERLDAVLLK